MKLQHIILSGVLVSLSMGTLAGKAEHRWNNLSDERKAKITERAAEQGYDISTKEGRKEFRQAMRKQRVERAAEQGYDIGTKEGRQAFKEARMAQRSEIRNAVKALSDEDRKALKEELKGLSREDRRARLKQRFGS